MPSRIIQELSEKKPQRIEAATRGVLSKKLVLKFLQFSLENIWVWEGYNKPLGTVFSKMPIFQLKQQMTK